MPFRKPTGNPMNAPHSGEGSPQVWHGTTILTVRKGGKVVIGGDGQVSIGQTVIKSNAKKVRRLGKGDVIGGFSRAPPHALSLFGTRGRKTQRKSREMSPAG